jgi:hypothetical protein
LRALRFSTIYGRMRLEVFRTALCPQRQMLFVSGAAVAGAGL